MDMRNPNAVWATVASRGLARGPGPRGRRIVRFEKGYVFLEDPGRIAVAVKPKRVERIDEYTISIDSGFWKCVVVRLHGKNDQDGVVDWVGQTL